MGSVGDHDAGTSNEQDPAGARSLCRSKTLLFLPRSFWQLGLAPGQSVWNLRMVHYASSRKPVLCAARVADMALIA